MGVSVCGTLRYRVGECPGWKSVYKRIWAGAGRRASCTTAVNQQRSININRWVTDRAHTTLTSVKHNQEAPHWVLGTPYSVFITDNYNTVRSRDCLLCCRSAPAHPTVCKNPLKTAAFTDLIHHRKWDNHSILTQLQSLNQTAERNRYNISIKHSN